MAGEGALGHQRGPRVPSAIGTPSAGLSLGGLRARRARLRFTRRQESSQAQRREQGQGEASALSVGSGKEQEAAAKVGRVREEREVAPGVPRLTVRLVKVRVP